MSIARRRIGTMALAAALVAGTAGHVGAEQIDFARAATTRVKVVMKDDVFKPKTMRVSKGTRIKWVNRGESPHTTTSRKGLWDKTLSPGDRWARTFKKAGTFRYYCRFHDGMTGKIVVA